MIIKTPEELKQHISVIAKNDFDLLKPFLKRAKRYLLRIIGTATYNAALAHYISQDYKNVNDVGYVQADAAKQRLDQLVDRIQDALVYYAYFLFSPEANVILTDSGYQVKWTEHNRPAQEWQLNKVVDSILTTAHENIDNLLDYLDENVDNFSFWDSSEEVQENKSLFINNAREFSGYFDIKDSRRIWIQLKSIQERMERVHILPAINSTRFADIHEEVIDGDISEANQLILDRICPALAFITMAEAVKLLPAQELVSVTQGNYNDLYQTGMQELKVLENYITVLDNALIEDEDDQGDEEFKGSVATDDDDLKEQKGFRM